MIEHAPRRSRWTTPACVVALLALGVLAFWLRTHFVRDAVFRGDQVRFSVVDSWLHVRLVENLVHNFPQRITFDPYALFPTGQAVPVAPLFDWLIALVAVVVGGGSPSARTVELVCAYSPVVLGCLTILPTYFLGKHLLNRTAGLLAAALLILYPGQFLSRTLLGYTDHHVAETLFSTTAILFFLLALRSGQQRELRLSAVALRPWAAAGRPLVFTGLAGLAVGAYLLCWLGGAMLVGILVVWLAVQFTVNQLQGRETGFLTAVSFPIALLAMVMTLRFAGEHFGLRLHVIALLALALLGPLLSGVAWIVARLRLPRASFPVLVLAAAALAAGLFALVAPDTFRLVLRQFERFGPSHMKRTIVEATPLLRGADGWSLGQTWSQFTTGAFVALPAVVVLIWRAVRRHDAGLLLVCVWSLGIFAALLAQRRFGYYFTVNVALLAGVAGAAALHGVWTRLGPRVVMIPGTRRGQSKKRRKRSKVEATPAPVPRTLPPPPAPVRYGSVALVGVAVFFGLFFPNFKPVVARARNAFTPHDDWMATFAWLRENTPEPFGDPNAYYARYVAPPAGEPYPYPDSAYGILCWWEDGYRITRQARRIPCANPGQRGAREVARFYTAGDEAIANEIVEQLGARYVIIDGSLPLLMVPSGQVKGKIGGMAHWAGRSKNEFYESVQNRVPGTRGSQFGVYYPAYFQTMLVRLYLHDGRPFPARDVHVMSYYEVEGPGDEPRKVATALRKFAGYEQAQAYLNTLPAGSARIVSTHPHLSCIPVREPVRSYRRVYGSPGLKGSPLGRPIPRVEVWEYQPPP